MANPQIRIIELPLTTDISTTTLTEYLPIESLVGGGRRIAVSDFFTSAGGAVFAVRPGSSVTNAIVRFSNSTGQIQYGYTGTPPTISDAGIITAPGFNSTSSLRYKKNVEDIHNGLYLVNQLQGVTYNLKSDDTQCIGLIAEDVVKVLPQVVGKNALGEPESVDYSKIVPLLIEAIKTLSEKVKDLEQQLNA